MQIRLVKIFTIFFSIILLVLNIQSCQDEAIDQNYADNDSDGFYDLIDNCPSISNPEQVDSNGDGMLNHVMLVVKTFAPTRQFGTKWIPCELIFKDFDLGQSVKVSNVYPCK